MLTQMMRMCKLYITIDNMETKCVTEEMRARLSAPLPPEAVTPHPTKKFLSSIKSIYVTERLNEVFGVGTWRVNTTNKRVMITYNHK